MMIVSNVGKETHDKYQSYNLPELECTATRNDINKPTGLHCLNKL